MLSSIRIGFFLHFLLLFLPAFSFAQARPPVALHIDSLNLPGMQQWVGELLGTVQTIAKDQLEKVTRLDSLQSSALDRWTLAKQDTTLPKLYIDSLGQLAKVAVSAHKKEYNAYVKTNKIKEQLEALPLNDSLSLRKNLPKSWKQVDRLYKDTYPPVPVETSAKEMPVADSSKTEKAKVLRPPSPPVKRFAAYSPAADVMLTPPARPCVIASSTRDEFSGEISRQLAAAELFRYTNPALKAYLQGKTHVVCEAALASNGANAVLHLTFIINDPNARKAFGRLEKNSLATLKFMDGSNFELQNAVADDGVFNPDSDGSVFHAQYPVTAELLKKMRRTELDKIRVLWSKGYDDYDVQQVDLLMRQAECLLQK